MLARAVHKSKREIEELVAEIAPRSDIPAQMRRLPQRIGLPKPPSRFARDGGPDSGKARDLEAPTTGVVSLHAAGQLNAARGPQLRPDGVASAPVGIVSQAVTACPPTVDALAPGRYRVQFTASTALRDKLERLRALLRPTVPDADLATVIELAITEKLERLEARRFAQSSRRRKELSDTDTTPRSRHIPAAIRRAVRERDGRQCGFVSKGGQALLRRRPVGVPPPTTVRPGWGPQPGERRPALSDSQRLAGRAGLREERNRSTSHRDAGDEARYSRSGRTQRRSRVAPRHSHRRLEAGALGRPTDGPNTVVALHEA